MINNKPKTHSILTTLVIYCVLTFLLTSAAWAQYPSSYDLREVGEEDYVTAIKSQSGGTCWAFGAYSSLESNLLMTGLWSGVGEEGEPDLAEYHLDWWNGFNDFFNADTEPPYDGVEVHNGGNYLMTAAYLSRGEGAVRDVDAQSYTNPPERFSDDYHHFYVRDIEWFTVGEDLSNINKVKQMVIDHGAVSTCLRADDVFMSPAYVHYQPAESPLPLNHAVGIIGWDDNMPVNDAPGPGAWLCKNSWGSQWGLAGYFWISYYDKFAGKHPTLGAVSFYNVEASQYDKVFYHDYHGWRDERPDISQAFNAFTAENDVLLKAVSFFTVADSVEYTAIVYDDFIEGELANPLAQASGFIAIKGMHTADLSNVIEFPAGEDFYIYVEFSNGGQAVDRTTRALDDIVGGEFRGSLISSAEAGQSYYFQDQAWHDLYEYDNSANFCIKGLGSEFTILKHTVPQGYEFEEYECNLRAIGGVEPYHWNYISGQFPYGCTFEGGTVGRVSGTPSWSANYVVRMEMIDSHNPPHADTANILFQINPARPICGDANGDRAVQISDVVYLVNYIFINGETPDPLDKCDVNCDHKINIVDIIYLINYVFKGGLEPCYYCPLY